MATQRKYPILIGLFIIAVFMVIQSQVFAKKAASVYEKGYVAPPLAPNAHFSWIPAYEDQEAVSWMFAQRKDVQYKSK